MQFTTIATLLFSAVMVSAGGEGGPPSGDSAAPAQACGNGQKFSCCNTGSSQTSVLGGSCELPILGQSCVGNQAFCCNATQNGLINVGSLCVPVTV